MYSGIPFPDLDPIAFQMGWFVIRWYSVAYILGLLLAWGLARRMSQKTHSTFTVLKIDDFLVWATFGIIIGGRLGYVLFYNIRYFLEFPLQVLALWEGGMSFHGGLLGVIAATFLFAYKKKISPLVIGDIVACVAPIGLFLGRLANFVNGELFGRITTSVPWAFVFPMGGNVPRHPSQLYEALAEGVLLFIVLNCIWWFSPKYRTRVGFITGLFFILYSVFRFGLEFLREPDGHMGFIAGSLTMGQVLCIPMLLFGWWLVMRRSPKVVLNRVKEGE